MADPLAPDLLAKYGLQPEQQPDQTPPAPAPASTPPQKPQETAPVPTVGTAPLQAEVDRRATVAKYGLQPEQSPPEDPNKEFPSAVSQFLQTGHAVVEEASPSQSWLHSMVSKIETGTAAVRNFEETYDPLQHVAKMWNERLPAEGAAARAQVAQGIKDILGNRPAQGVSNVTWGTAVAIFAPVTALSGAIGQEATNMTGNPDFGEKVGLLSQGAFGVPVEGRAAYALRNLNPAEMNPGVITKEGQFARLHLDPNTGEIHPQVIGPAPEAPDFEAAGKLLAQKHAAMEARTAGQPEPAPGEVDPEKTARFTQHVRNNWSLNSMHPAETVERAEQSPTVLHDLSAAQAPVVAVPANPTPRFITDADNTMHNLITKRQGMDEDIMEIAGTLPPELRERIDPALLGELHKLNATDDLPLKERFLRYMEGDPTHGMTDEHIALYEKFVKSLRTTQAELYEWLSNTDLPRFFKDEHGRDFESEFDPTYSHRMVIGKTPALDIWTNPLTEEEANPIMSGQAVPTTKGFFKTIADWWRTGRGPGILNRHPSSLEHASYWVARDEAGNRILVRSEDNGRTMVPVSQGKLRQNFGMKQAAKGGAGEPIEKLTHPEGFKFRKGDAVEAGGHTWEITNAWTREIEAQTSTRYYHDPMLALLHNIREMQTAKEAIYTLNKIKDTDEFANYAAPRGSANIPNDWVTPELPFFEGYRMHPKLAAVFDNFWRRPEKESLSLLLRKANRAAIGSLFLTPVPHLLNEAGFFISDRFFDWLNPLAYRRMAIAGAKAIREVYTNGKIYREFQKKGASFHYGPTVNSQQGGFYARLLRTFGEQITSKRLMPEGWEGIADMVGEPVADVIAAWYKQSSRILWMGSDIMHLTRMMERMETGASIEDAIKRTEDWLPSYRTPPQLLGSTHLKNVYFNNLAFEFSRYHYDIFKGYAKMIGNMVGGTRQERLDAIGRLLGVAALQTVVYPLMSAGIHEIPGMENTEMPSWGPGKLSGPITASIVNNMPGTWPKWIEDYYHDKRGVGRSTFLSFFAPSPALRLAEGIVSQKQTPVSTMPIVEPGETNILRGTAQGAEWLAQNTVSPYEFAAEAYREGLSPEQITAQVLFGLRTRPEWLDRYLVNKEHKEAKHAKWRLKEPRGPIEGLANKLTQ